MCGISGYISHNKIELKESLIAMAHRGPDAIGEYYYDFENVNIGLGHRRLSIIDLTTAANQPFHNNQDNYSIIFNGEIYNYESLKSELITKGHVFETNGDTEVLLHMYIEYGTEMLNRLNGIFAFCILDKVKGQLFIVRDQLGIKPIYFYQDAELFAFASEIKSLEKIPGVKKEIDKNQLTEFLLNGFLYEPDTGFKDIKKVSPGTYWIIDFKHDSLMKREQVTYWAPVKKDYKIEQVEELLKRSIHEQTVSDVPLGVFFSGGVDSSIILSELRKETHAFVVKASEKEYQEAGMTSDFGYATKIAGLFDANLEAVKLSDNEVLDGDTFLNQITYLSKVTEEPIADFTFISSQQLSHQTKKRGYTVMLSGMGADEIFGGYPRYQMLKFEKLFSFIRPFVNVFFANVPSFKKKIDRFNSFLAEKEFVFKYTNLVGVFSKPEISGLLKEQPLFEEYKNKLSKILMPFTKNSNVKKAMILDLYGFLSHNFMVADKSSMLESQELRVPLATKDLFELGFSLEDSELIGLKKTKKPLRTMLLKELPGSIVNRRKAGFNPPMDSAINDIGYNKCIEFVERNNLFEILNRAAVEKVFNNHYLMKANNTYKIFQLLYLSSWYNTNKQ
jgi:asparagine synthase (glutamine-hydrolysing)